MRAARFEARYLHMPRRPPDAANQRQDERTEHLEIEPYLIAGLTADGTATAA